MTDRREVFEVTDNYIKCKILFDKKVLELSSKNVGLNTRDDIVELCRCTPNHASWLLRQLVKDNVIQLYGAGRGAFYKKL